MTALLLILYAIAATGIMCYFHKEENYYLTVYDAGIYLITAWALLPILLLISALMQFDNIVIWRRVDKNND